MGAAWSLDLPAYARTIRILLESRICCHHQHLGAHALEPLAQLRVFALLSIWAPELPNHTLCMFDTADLNSATLTWCSPGRSKHWSAAPASEVGAQAPADADSSRVQPRS